MLLLCVCRWYIYIYTGISVELITPNVIKLTLPPYLEIVVRRNQKLNLTQKTFEASQSVHRYQDALKTFFPGYFGRSCEHRALLPIVVLGDVIAVDSYGVMLSKSKESIDTNKRNWVSCTNDVMHFVRVWCGTIVCVIFWQIVLLKFTATGRDFTTQINHIQFSLLLIDQ